MVYHLITLLCFLLFALYDYQHHKIRSPALAVFFLWCLFSIPVTLYSRPILPWYYVVLYCLFGFITGFCLLLLIAIVTDGGIGGGDIKLVALTGILYGASGLLLVLIFGCMAALLHYGFCRLRKKNRLERIPFAPYLFLGCCLYTLPQLF